MAIDVEHGACQAESLTCGEQFFSKSKASRISSL